MVWPPFALITASMHLGILSMRFWHTSGAILFHSLTNLSYNSRASLGGLLYMQSCHLRCSQRCSMGLRSRYCAGHDRTLISLSSNHSVAFWEVCLGSLSCWKYRSPSSISNFSKIYTTPSLKFWQYWSVFIFPSTFISIHTPFQPIHEIILSSMLYSWSCSAIWDGFPPLFPYIHLPIWSNPIYLSFICPQDSFLILYCPVSMPLCKL